MQAVLFLGVQVMLGLAAPKRQVFIEETLPVVV
jgi:hypothetical protein